MTEDDPYPCPDCGKLVCVCADDDDQPEFEDLWMDECGMMPDGYCMLAGTEWCDWDCPRGRA